MPMTTEQRTQIIKAVVGVFGAAPGATYLDELSAYAGNTGALIQDLTNTSAFSALYPSYLTSAEFAGKYMDSLLGDTVADTDKAWATAWMAAGLDAGNSVGQMVFYAIDALNSVAADNAAWGAAKQQFDNKVVVAEYYSVTMDMADTDLDALLGVLANVTNTTDVSTPAAIETAISGSVPTDAPIQLTHGMDTLYGTADNDTFVAKVGQNVNGEQTNTLGTGDYINGGAGTDTLNAKVITASALNAPPSMAITPETVSVENVNISAQTNNWAVNNVEVNAKDMLGLESIGSTQSDASLIISNLTTLTNSGEYEDRRNTESITIRYDHSGNGDAVAPESDLTVLFDQDYLLADRTDTGTALYWILDQDADEDGVVPLNNINIDGIRFKTDLGDGLKEYIIRADGAEDSGTHQAFIDALNVVLATMIANGELPAGTTISLDPALTRTTFLDNGTLSDPIPAIVLTLGGGFAVSDPGFAQVEDAIGDYNVFGRTSTDFTSEANLVTSNIELFKVGRGSDGGDLIVGGMSTDLQNVWDSGSGSKGVEKFNVEVQGDQTQMSSLSSMASTNNTLRVVDVTWAEGSLADLTIGNSATDAVVPNAAGDSALDLTSNLNSALKDVQIFTATNNNSATLANDEVVTNDVTLYAHISDEAVAKYMDLTDVAADPAIDNANFVYTFGAGNDTLNINISKANLAASGTTNREDFDMDIVMGAGDDVVEAQIGDGFGTATSAWYINSKMDQNLGIATEDGNDIVRTYGASSWAIDAGAGDDAVYTDNSGNQADIAFNNGRATWVLNTADQVGATAAARNIDDLVSDVNDDYALYKSTVTVSFRGLTASVTVEDYNTTDLELNNLIKKAISEDVHLSKLIVAEDGPANTLVISSLVDGDFTAADFAVAMTAPVELPAMAPASLAEFAAANGIDAALITSSADVLAAINADLTAFALKGDYISAFANEDAAGVLADIIGADSVNANSNIIVDGSGQDVIVLSTSGLDQEVVNLTADGQADVIFNATNAIINGLEINDIVIASDGSVTTGATGTLTVTAGGVIPPTPGGTITLTAGTTAPVAATADADTFAFSVAAAQALEANTQIEITGFDAAADALRIDSATALGTVTLDQLNGKDGIAVQVNGITGETLVNFGPDANGDVIAITLAGVADPTLVNVTVI